MQNKKDISNRDLATIVNLHIEICQNETLCVLWAIVIFCLNGFNAPIWTMILAGVPFVDAFVKKYKTMLALEKIVKSLNFEE